MKLGTFTKQPVEIKDYDIDYTKWMPVGDSIQSVTASISPAGLTLGSVLVNGLVVKIWLSGGTNGLSYKITVNVTTTGGRLQQDEFFIKVKEI
jgi:hypothetical protein